MDFSCETPGKSIDRFTMGLPFLQKTRCLECSRNKTQFLSNQNKFHKLSKCLLSLKAFPVYSGCSFGSLTNCTCILRSSSEWTFCLIFGANTRWRCKDPFRIVLKGFCRTTNFCFVGFLFRTRLMHHTSSNSFISFFEVSLWSFQSFPASKVMHSNDESYTMLLIVQCFCKWRENNESLESKASQLNYV